MSCTKCDGSGIAHQQGAITITCDVCASPESDEINPGYYKKNSTEVIDFAVDCCRDLPGDESIFVYNAIKYLARYREKHPNPRTDIEKAKWNINRLRNLLLAKQAAGE
jgi:hypothetical protein